MLFADCAPTQAEPEPAVPVVDKSSWGQHLREIRRAKGISQRALGEASGVDFTYISRIERGEFPPPAGRTIERIAGVLGVDAVELAHSAGKVVPGYIERLERRAEVANRRIAELKRAIRRVLDDEESRPGAWGPDVTCVAILRNALAADDASVGRADAGETR